QYTAGSTTHSAMTPRGKCGRVRGVFSPWAWIEGSAASPFLSVGLNPPSNGWACRSLVLLLIAGPLSGQRAHRLLQVRGLQLDACALRCRLRRRCLWGFGVIAEGQPAQTGARDVLNKEGRRGDGQGSRPLLEEGGHRLAGTGDQVDAAGNGLEGAEFQELTLVDDDHLVQQARNVPEVVCGQNNRAGIALQVGHEELVEGLATLHVEAKIRL